MKRLAKKHITLVNLIETVVLGAIGGLIYVLLEVLFRGYSHWTMFLLGGLCFSIIGKFNEHIPWETPIQLQMLLGGAVITALELFVGIFVNIIFKLHLWDYSNLPFNFMGQICLYFSLLWCLLSLVIIFLDDYLRWKIFKEEIPHYTLNIKH